MTGGDAKGGASAAYDVFLSHASEDKARFVEPLYKALTARGLTAWFDKAEIEWGDDLHQRMAEGLQRSRFGIIVLSPSFLKYWPGKELSAFLAQEAATKTKRVLPVLLDLTWDQVAAKFPFMGARACARAEEGVEALAERAYRLVKGLSPIVTNPDAGPDSRPAPTFLNDRHRSLNERLKSLKREKALAASGRDTTALDQQMVAIKRELRAGPELVPGDRLSDRYELLESLGRGGFATVWRAYDEARAEQVAIKVLHGQLTRSADRVERFFRGSRLMQSLKHPHIVEVREQQREDEGHRYFVMELLTGGDLWRAIREKTLTLESILDVIEATAKALAFAHQRGVIHRDVKPENILLTADGTSKLTDFDLVRAADTTGGTQTGALGTLIYAAPEALEDASRAGPSVDVYSLAMTAVVALKGRRPRIKEKLQPETLIDSLDVWAGVADLLKSSLQVKTEERPRDAEAFFELWRSARRTEQKDTQSHKLLHNSPRPARAPFTLNAPILLEGNDGVGEYLDVAIPDARAGFRMRLIPQGRILDGCAGIRRRLACSRRTSA